MGFASILSDHPDRHSAAKGPVVIEKASIPTVGLMLLLCATAAQAQSAIETKSDRTADGTSAAIDMPGGDQAFIVGLRRIGVVAGQHVACLPHAAQSDQISKMTDVGMDLAAEYGLRVAFNFIGAAGYGSGLPVRQVDCPHIAAEWSAIVQKYGAR